MPKISVIMPCYNGQNFVAEAIDSILSQTFDDFELLIIDDGSTDKSADVILSFKDKRIRYIKNEKNIGLIKTLNKGLDLSNGEYVARMDADDISYPERFAMQTKLLDDNHDVVMCGTWINFFNYPPRAGDGHHATEITYLSILSGWCINHPTVMFRKSVLDSNGLRYDESYPSAEDYELWSRMIRFGRIVNIPQVLLDYRWHNNNISVVKESQMKETVARVKQNMLQFLTTDIGKQKELLEISARPPETHIPVFLASDENFAPMILTTILSVMENTKSKVDFYILSNGITISSQEKIYSGVKKYKNCTIEFIPIDVSFLESFQDVDYYISKTAYLRLLIPIIRPNLDKVIYSDIDVIFTGDIAELYNENLDDKIIGVIPDVYYQINLDAKNNVYNRLSLPPEHEYFYSGMILMDCVKWRVANATKNILELAEKFGDRIKQGDQDLLNVYFACDYKELDPKYEVTNFFLMYKKRLSKDKRKSISNPIIRHYESHHKPWNSKKFQNKKMEDWKLWWKYAKKTPWYNELLENLKRKI
ncbi:MAG: glycosyltransferase [Helicobacteraceae bacterium]|jgi:lipopolysaccharide biosynthesis glycosyltransferase|nr:glycosyltransferase [Helicobacteraceae bacterium]